MKAADKAGMFLVTVGLVMIMIGVIKEDTSPWLVLVPAIIGGCILLDSDRKR